MKKSTLELSIVDLVSPEFSVEALKLNEVKKIDIDLRGLFHRQYSFWRWQAPVPANPQIMTNIKKIIDALYGNFSVRAFNIHYPKDRPGAWLTALALLASIVTAPVYIALSFFPMVSAALNSEQKDTTDNSVDTAFLLRMLGGITLIAALCIVPALFSFLVRQCCVVPSELAEDFQIRLERSVLGLERVSAVGARDRDMVKRMITVLENPALPQAKKDALWAECTPAMKGTLADHFQVGQSLGVLSVPPPSYHPSAGATAPPMEEKKDALTQPLLVQGTACLV